MSRRYFDLANGFSMAEHLAARGYTVLALDHPGVGDSPPPDDPWTLSDVLLHPAQPAAARAPWDEWLDPHLRWRQRWQALVAQPRRDREDWYYRWMLAARHR